jgi:FdhD protein
MSDAQREAASCWQGATVRRWPGQGSVADDAVAEETAVALSFNGIAHVVMMMTPADLEDFALGFSLSEGIVERPLQVYDMRIIEREQGMEVALSIATERFEKLKHMRRNLAGRTGCGLCGAESLEQAVREAPAVESSLVVEASAVQRAVRSLSDHQPLQQRTGAVHAAAWCGSEGDVMAVREDVGRHNALDKLIGAMARARMPTDTGFVLVSSRASYEMVTKAARAGIAMVVAVSAPTTLAMRLAASSGVTLAAFARADRFSVYTGAHRVRFAP